MNGFQIKYIDGASGVSSTVATRSAQSFSAMTCCAVLANAAVAAGLAA